MSFALSRTVIIVVLPWLACTPVFAGVVFEMQVKDYRQSPPKTQDIEIVVEGQALMMDLVSRDSAEPDEMIFLGDRREMIFVDHDLRSFMLIEQETLERIGGHSDAARAHLEKALENVPEAQREMVAATIEKSLQEAKPPERPERRIERSGERSTQQGYPSAHYEVYLGADRIRELWVTAWSDLENGREVEATLEQMSDFFSLMVVSIARFGQGKAPLDDLAFEHLREMGGFPVVIREFSPKDGALEVEMTLRAVWQKTIDANTFKQPPDYSQREVFAASRP